MHVGFRFAHLEPTGTFPSVGGKVLKEILLWQWDGIFSSKSRMYITGPSQLC